MEAARLKYALIIPDGCADEPQESLGGRTPLEAADVPEMDAIAAAGFIGRAETVPASLPAGSDVGTMSLFGYDPLVYHTGRAPIEAAAQGIQLGPGDWAIRCNLVTVENGVMKSFTAHQIPNDDGAELIELLQRDGCGDAHWKFHAGVSYRNLLLYRARGDVAPFSAETKTVPPHDIIDQPIAAFLPDGPGSEELRRLMDQSAALFTAHRSAATRIWLWGLGDTPEMPSFQERFGKTAAVITAVDLPRGLGRLLDWRIIDVPGATGYTDTDYAAKGRHAIEALEQGVDIVVVHVEATDEASHEGDASAKVAALEQIDREIVGPVHDSLKAAGDYRIVVSPDHPTLLRTKTHSHGLVPFALCGNGISSDAATEFSETAAEKSPVEIHGHELMPMLFG